MSISATTAKEVSALAATYRERQQAVAAAQAELTKYMAVNPTQQAAIKQYQTDYLAFLQTGNLVQGAPTSPLPHVTGDGFDPLADSLKQWQREASRLASTRKDIVKATGDAAASDTILAQLDKNEVTLPAITSILMKHTPLFEITNPPTKEEVIAAIVAAEKDVAKQPALAQATKEKYAKVTSASEILMDYMTDGKAKTVPTQDGTQLNADQAKKLGAVLLQVEKAREKAPGATMHRPEAVLIGADGKSYTLEAKELSAYLQTAKPSGTIQQPVDDWAKKQGVALNNHGKEYSNGKVGGFLNFGETLYIETPQGQRRTVSNGIITEPLAGGHYGSIKGLKVGDKDDLDVYVSDKILKDIQAGKKYEGKIQVMQQMDKGKPDELKVGFTDSLAEFRTIQASTWKPSTGFGKSNEGAYVELTYDQWKVLKEDIAKKPDLSLADFVKAHPEMKLAVTEKKDLPYVRSVDGPKPEEIAAQKAAFKALQENVFNATDGIGADAARTAARTAQPALIDAAKKAYIAGTLGATEADAAKAVTQFAADITTKTNAYSKAWDLMANAAKAGSPDAELAPLRAATIAGRLAALGENINEADTAQRIDRTIVQFKQAGEKERAAQIEAAKAAIVVEEHTINVGPQKGLSQTIRDQAKDVVATIKSEMEKAGMKDVTDKDAAFVAAMMVASENTVVNANKAKGELKFAFTRGEIDAAITKVKEQTQGGADHAASLYKAGELQPNAIVGQMVREQGR